MPMFSPSVNLSCDCTSCFGLPDSRSFSLSAVPGNAVSVFPCSSPHNKNHSYVTNGRLNWVYSRDSFICNASSGGHRRNPDFLRQNKHGFRGRNRLNEERDSFDSGLDESEILSSKNGPILSVSNSTKFQTAASPGPKDREIVELFRKVQAQLRERAAAKKEDKRVKEASRGTGKESETVDSLLKLLRKHSGEQGNIKAGSIRNQEFSSDQLEENDVYNEDQSKQQNAASLTRPPSRFRRNSPVRRFKSQATHYSGEETFESSSNYNSVWTRKKNPVELYHEPKYEPEPEPEPESELRPESLLYEDENEVSEAALVEISNDESLDTGADADYDDEDDDDDDGVIKHEDLNALKLTELRAIAKSRGVKGLSRMRKAELVELLSG